MTALEIYQWVMYRHARHNVFEILHQVLDSRRFMLSPCGTEKKIRYLLAV